jgi:antitoxin (DNA-binding transcriptional repressor) of toxin-antitoxin stability system
MGTHTVAEARDHLPELIGRAREGEAVVITQDDDPVVELKPIQKPQLKKPLRRLTEADIEWLRQNRAPHIKMTIDSVSLVRMDRDESDHHFADVE